VTYVYIALNRHVDDHNIALWYETDIAKCSLWTWEG